MEEVRNYSFTVTYEVNDLGKGEYLVVFNDCKNIIGTGDTIEEAINEAEGNLDAYLAFCEEEGIEPPHPSKFDWMNDYSGKITLRMPKSLHRDIAEYAEKDGLSLNSIINDAIRQYLMCSSISELKESLRQESSLWFSEMYNDIVSRTDIKYQDRDASYQTQYDNHQGA